MEGDVAPVLLITLIAYFGVGYGWTLNQRRSSDRISTLQEMILSNLSGSIIHVLAYYIANKLKEITQHTVKFGDITEGFRDPEKQIILSIERIFTPYLRLFATFVTLVCAFILYELLGIGLEIPEDVGAQLFLVIASLSVLTGSFLYSVNIISSEFASEKYGWLPERPCYQPISLSLSLTFFLAITYWAVGGWDLLTNNVYQIILAFIAPFVIMIIDKVASRYWDFSTIQVGIDYETDLFFEKVNNKSKINVLREKPDKSKLNVLYEKPVKNVRIYFESPDDVEIEYASSEDKEEYLTKENPDCTIRLFGSGDRNPGEDATVDIIAKYVDPDDGSDLRSIKIETNTIKISEREDKS